VSVAFERLRPAGPPVDARTHVESLTLVIPEARPRVLVNLVISADGHVAVDGRSAPLTDPGDRAMFHALRERVDAVMAGPATVATERYGRLIPDPDRRARRQATGREPEPLAVIASRSGELPLQVPLFDVPEARIVVFSPVAADQAEVAAQLHQEEYDSGVEGALAGALTTLRRRYGVQTLLCEGGPTLVGLLLAEQLVDDLFLTIAPKLIGNVSPAPVIGGPPLLEPAGLRLVDVLIREGTLFLRYVRTAAG
jgi:riboflavin biosynthesis pyrimidine reductase